jgi:hypothetical protein
MTGGSTIIVVDGGELRRAGEDEIARELASASPRVGGALEAAR